MNTKTPRANAAKFTIVWVHDTSKEVVDLNVAQQLETELEQVRSWIAKMSARVHNGEHTEDCPFCKTYPATGHSQQAPMCHLCVLESERDALRATLEADRKELNDRLIERQETLVQRSAELLKLRRELDAMKLEARQFDYRMTKALLAKDAREAELREALAQSVELLGRAGREDGTTWEPGQNWIFWEDKVSAKNTMERLRQALALPSPVVPAEVAEKPHPDTGGCSYTPRSNEPCATCPRLITALHSCKLLQESASES